MKADICCLLLLAGVLIGFEAIAAARNPNFNLNVNLRPPRNDGRGTGKYSLLYACNYTD